MDQETGDPSAPSAAARPAVLTRSRRHKMIGGVCGGAGRYFGIDPVVFRVVIAVLALSGGIGLAAYGIGWLLIPLDGEDETEVQRLLSGRLDGTALTAALCVLGGGALFLSTLNQGGNELFSLLLLAALVGAVHRSRQRGARPGQGQDGVPPAGGPGAVPGPPPAAGPPPAEAPSWWREPQRQDGYLWGPEDGAPGREQVVLTKPGPAPGPAAEAPAAAAGIGHPYAAALPRRGGFGGFSFLLAVLAAAGTVAGSVQDHPLGTALEYGFTAALTVLGAGLVLSALLRRPTGGTVFWALVAAVLLAGAAALPKSVSTRWTTETWRPASTAEVQPRYRIGAGQGTLDLTGLDLHGGTVSTGADIGAGRLVVRVPRDAVVQLTAKIGLGDLRLPSSDPGAQVGKPGSTQSATLKPPAGTAAGGTLVLTLHVGLGQAEVLRGSRPK